MRKFFGKTISVPLVTVLWLGAAAGAWAQACKGEAGVVYKFLGGDHLNRSIDFAAKASQPELIALIERSENILAQYPVGVAHINTIGPHLDICLAKVYLKNLTAKGVPSSPNVEIKDDTKAVGGGSKG